MHTWPCQIAGLCSSAPGHAQLALLHSADWLTAGPLKGPRFHCFLKKCFCKHVLQHLECPLLKRGCRRFLLLSNTSPRTWWLETTPTYYLAVSVGQAAECGMEVLCSGPQEAGEGVGGNAAPLEWEGFCGTHSACWQIPAGLKAEPCFLAALSHGTSSTGHSQCLLACFQTSSTRFQPFKGVTWSV